MRVGLAARLQRSRHSSSVRRPCWNGRWLTMPGCTAADWRQLYSSRCCGWRLTTCCGSGAGGAGAGRKAVGWGLQGVEMAGLCHM